MVSELFALRTLSGTSKKVDDHTTVIQGASVRYRVSTGTSHLWRSLETNAANLPEMSVSSYWL